MVILATGSLSPPARSNFELNVDRLLKFERDEGIDSEIISVRDPATLLFAWFICLIRLSGSIADATASFCSYR